MSIQTDANTVLRKLVYSPTQNPKQLYYFNDLQYEPSLRDYDYCTSVFQFIKDKFPEFITVMSGTKPNAHIHMRAGREEEIKRFIDEGGCEDFEDYAAFRKFIKEQKEKSSSPTNITHINDNRQYTNEKGIQIIDSAEAKAKIEDSFKETKETDKKKGFWEKADITTKFISVVLSLCLIVGTILEIKSCTQINHKSTIQATPPKDSTTK